MDQLNGSLTKITGTGYDLPVTALGTKDFLRIHVIALSAILLSFISVIIILIASFTHQNVKMFFKWSKPERFVVYLALCDGLFNIVHATDHAHIAVSRDHVRPPSLCVFYAMMLIEFAMAQHIMVCIICVNAFFLVFCEKNFHFGKFDWRLLCSVFGLPILVAVITASMKVLGPNGAFCYFDGVTGKTAYIYLNTVPIVIVIVSVSILYTLTWLRIRKTEPKFKDQFNKKAHRVRASHRAARNMSLFVVAFVVQWWSAAFFGLWQITTTTPIPQFLFQLLTFFPNIGGVLNLIVYFIIRLRKLRRGSDYDAYQSSSSSGNILRINSVEKKYSSVSTTDI